MKLILLPIYLLSLSVFSQESGIILYHEKTNLEKEKEQISKSLDSSINEDPEAAQLMEMISSQLQGALSTLGNKDMELSFNKDAQLYKKQEITADNIPQENNIDFQMNAYTNEDGIATFEIDSSVNGDVFVTSRCHNCIPVETEFEITDDFPEVTLDENSIIVEGKS